MAYQFLSTILGIDANFTGNVGVGTTTPSYKLDVNGTGRIQNNLTVTKGASNYFTFDANTNTNDLFIQFFKAGAFETRLYTKNNYSVGALTIQNGLSVTDSLGSLAGFSAGQIGANFGILAVTNIGGNAQIHIASPSGYSNYVSFRENGVSDRGIFGYQNGTSYMQVRTNSATNMSNGTFSTAFFSSGNVGIGTTTDAGYKLDVNGTARIQGNTTITATNIPLSITGSGSSAYSMNSGNDVYFAFNSQSAAGRFYANPQGSVQYTYDQPSSVGFVGTLAGGSVWYGNMNSSGGAVKYNCSQNGAVHSHIWYYNFTEQMRLQYTGNLLIGTSTDSGYKLDVNGNSRIKGSGNTSATTTFRVENSSGGSAFTILGDGTVNMGFNATLTYGMTARSYGSNGGYPGLGVYLISQNYGNAAGNAATIAYSGSPAGVTSNGLVIGGGFALQSATYNALVVNQTYTGLGTNTFVGYLFDPTLDATFPAANIISIKTTKGNALLCTTSGNVGIGTLSPSYKLDVNGTARATTLITDTVTTTASTTLAGYSGSTYTYGPLTANQSIYTFTFGFFNVLFGNITLGYIPKANTIGMSDSAIYNSGANNVLIGSTTDNGNKLQVTGSATVSSQLVVGGTTGNGYTLNVEGSATFAETVIQNLSVNGNALGGITSYQGDSNLTNNFSNGTYSGETIDGELSSNVTAGQLLYLKQSSRVWELVDATTTASSTTLIGIACTNGATSDVIPILLSGFYASNAYFTAGASYGVPMYLDTTAGKCNVTAPSATGNVVRIVGHVHNYNNTNGCVVLRFNPDNFWLVI